MNNTRRATDKRRSGSNRARLRRGEGGPGRASKPPVKSESELCRGAEWHGGGGGPPG